MVWQSSYQSRFLRADPSAGRFHVNRTAFTDAKVFQEEKAKILKRSWVFLGHESEVAKPGDYITRKILDYNLIFCKDRNGAVHAYFNSCTHRGATILRDPSGNKKSFTCPYHGWTFSNAGKLVDQSAKYGYPESFAADGIYDLVNVPRIESRSGFWFVNFDKDAIGLTEYLGDAADRIDMIAEHSAAGLEVINGCHEYYIRANYKLMCENSYDGYHLNITHASYVDYMKEVTKGIVWDPAAMTNHSRALTNGHACFEMDIPAGRPIAQWLPIWGDEVKAEIESKRAEVYERLGEERGAFITKWHRNMIIFPATVMNDQQSILIRSLIPISHNETIVRAWAMGPVDETPLLRKIRLENVLSFLGPGGFATPDDVEMLESCQLAYEGSMQEWNDVSKGFVVGEDSQRGNSLFDNELQMRAYWAEYDRRMNEVQA
jgi:p-cumate 2,3-dioxygenase subunit alpha